MRGITEIQESLGVRPGHPELLIAMFHLNSYESRESFSRPRFATQSGPEHHDRNESTALRMLRPILFSSGLRMPYQLLIAAVDGRVLMMPGEIEVVVGQKLITVILRIAAPLPDHRQEHQGASDLDDLLVGYRGKQCTIVLYEFGDVASELGGLLRYLGGVKDSWPITVKVGPENPQPPHGDTPQGLKKFEVDVYSTMGVYGAG